MKNLLKNLVSWGFIVIVSPLLLLHAIALAFNEQGIFLSATQFLSLLPGKTGSYCRIAFNRFAMSYCSPDCLIGFATVFSQKNTEIHQGVYIGPQCNIGMCRIEKNTLIASGVHIMSGNKQHNFQDLDTPIQQQGGSLEKITIGEDSWIGNGSLVMANIGKKCIVGAGSVVIRDLPDYSIAVGNPARIIKSRLESITIDAETAPH
jgi:virginiamycin A acetyltransferase